MKQYTALFLDWDDTIGDFMGASARSLQEMYVHYGLDRIYSRYEDFCQVYQAHNTQLWERYGTGEVRKDYLEFDRFFYPLICGPEQLPVAEALQIAPRMAADHLRHTTDYFAPLPGAVEAVQALSRKYRLIVVSNGFSEVQYTKIDRSGLRECFEDIVLSEEVGIQKPNPGIYHLALERNGLSADEVLMIGDSHFSDISGAAAAGIDQLWLVGDGSKKKSGQSATYELPELRDVVGFLAAF